MAAKSAPKKNPSALKRVRQSEKIRLRNQSYKTMIKTCIKKLEIALKENIEDNINKTLRQAIKTISSVASKGIIHKNTASRNISRITKKTNAAIKK